MVKFKKGFTFENKYYEVILNSFNIAAYISGSGTNLLHILRNCENGYLNSRVKLVISNNAEAKGLDFARERSIKVVIVNRKDYQSRQDFAIAQLNVLKESKINLIVLAGYLRKLSGEVVRAYKNRILNIHPALLPKFGGKGFYGMNVHKAVIASGDKESGPTVHFVDEIYDNGEIVHQRKITIKENETAESLQRRVIQEEYKAFSEAIKILEKE